MQEKFPSETHIPSVHPENILVLQMIPGVGIRKMMDLIRQAPFLLGEPLDKNFWLYVQKRLHGTIAKTDQMSFHARALSIISRADKGEFKMIHYFQSIYSPLLKNIYDPPLLLFCKGNDDYLGLDSIAMVGARQATDYGVAVAAEFAARLAESGLVIIGGMAKGIDSAAHVGALKSKGKTVAVLGSGIDVVYPKEARHLYKRLCEEGCVVSEFLPGIRPNPQNFPVRNRIISGLSLGTVIVEATQRSGSLITARLAIEQNRELFAVPGPVHSPFSVGTNYLIKQGAKLVQIWQDVIEELPSYVQKNLTWRPCMTIEDTQTSRPLNEQNKKLCLTKGEERIYKLLFFERKSHMDALIEQTKLKVGELGCILLNLQMKGLIVELPGQYYLKNVSIDVK